MPTLVRSFKEAMRLYPPLTVLVRQATETITVSGVEVPKRTLMFVPIWSLHRNPAVWDAPTVFDPDRFTPENDVKRHRAAWLPFGIGPRVCIGHHFAMLEGPLVLATLLQCGALQVETAQALEPEDFATLRPKNGVWASVDDTWCTESRSEPANRC
jgi:cytochrome P450